MTGTCKNCRWWVPVRNTDWFGGECRRRAPVVLVIGDEAVSVSPETDGTHGCGEYVVDPESLEEQREHEARDLESQKRHQLEQREAIERKWFFKKGPPEQHVFAAIADGKNSVVAIMSHTGFYRDKVKAALAVLLESQRIVQGIGQRGRASWPVFSVTEKFA